jgi:hypothetical protein
MQAGKGFAALSLDSSSTSVDSGVDIDADGVPYLVALHSDPQLTEKVKYKLREGDVTVGSGADCDIQLGGVYMSDTHCTFQCEQVVAWKPAKAVKKGGGSGGFALFCFVNVCKECLDRVFCVWMACSGLA